MEGSSTVWMVHARTGLDGVKGVLSMEDEALVFRPDGGRSAQTVLPLRSLTRVRRARGSPVLEVRVQLSNAPGVIGFYFIRPPHLIDRAEGTKLFSRYLAKRKALQKLRAGNAKRREDVVRWVEAIRKGSPEPETGEATP